MAIYTNYGRYLKAKMFKEMLEEQGETYMLFGLGNPQWDNDNPNNIQTVPVASYNTEAMRSPDDPNTNQFYDNEANVWFNTRSGNDPTDFTYGAVQAVDHGLPATGSDGVQEYARLCRRLIPPFPCIFTCGTDDVTVLRSSDTLTHEVLQSNYQEFYITKEANNQYRLRNVSGGIDDQINIPQDTSMGIQYFAEAYIRGKALTSTDLPPSLKPPVGLLGAVKCNIDFVKDIGGEDSNLYTGSIDQFWYGDRYWQIVNPNENKLIGESGSYIETGDIEINQGIYPHHIIFTATVNPRILCEELNIDQYLVPRQIAIFTRKRQFKIIGTEGNEHIDANVDEDNHYHPKYEEGPLYYRAYENIFNFGQYYKGEISDSYKDKILNFTLPCYCGNVNDEPYNTPGGDFKFLLNDYIRGQVRELHSVDRFGYVIGF